MSMWTGFLLASTLAAAEPQTELWAGHQVVRGIKPIFMMGDLETQTETFVIARVTRTDNALLIEQRACEMDIKETLGIKVSMAPAALQALPTTAIRFAIDPQGGVKAPPWEVGWTETDFDKDGNPGVTVSVISRMCSGDLYIQSDSVTTATGATLTENGLKSDVSVAVHQDILGASRTCLKLGAGETYEKQTGQMVYRQIPAGTTCSDLSAGSWPVLVPSR
ncbi:MAG: hypothetical protein AAFV53_10775 [Myxococcota bacterium]